MHNSLKTHGSRHAVLNERKTGLQFFQKKRLLGSRRKDVKPCKVKINFNLEKHLIERRNITATDVLTKGRRIVSI